MQSFTRYNLQDIISRLQGLQRLQIFRLCHFRDIKVLRVAKFQTLSSSGYHIKVARVGRVTKFQSYHFQDIKVARVAEVANFQTLSFPGYQGCEGCKSCKV